jgi:hypothetical protein
MGSISPLGIIVADGMRVSSRRSNHGRRWPDPPSAQRSGIGFRPASIWPSVRRLPALALRFLPLPHTGRTTVLQGAVHLMIFSVYVFTVIVP